MADEDDTDELFDEELEEGEEEEDYMDMGGLLTSLLTNEDGENVCTALVSIGKQLEMQNKIMIKILTVLKKDST